MTEIDQVCLTIKATNENIMFRYVDLQFVVKISRITAVSYLKVQKKTRFVTQFGLHYVLFTWGDAEIRFPKSFIDSRRPEAKSGNIADNGCSPLSIFPGYASLRQQPSDIPLVIPTTQIRYVIRFLHAKKTPAWILLIINY